jgi:hypothetical protein
MKNRIVVPVLVLASSGCMKSFDRYHAKEVEIEAKMVMKNIGISLVTGYMDRQALCPASTPVPADVDLLKDKPYETKVGEWDTTWKCVLDTDNDIPANPFDMQKQHFQYAVAPADETTTVVTAKGYPGGAAGGLHTLTMTCKVIDKDLKCGDVEGLSP